MTSPPLDPAPSGRASWWRGVVLILEREIVDAWRFIVTSLVVGGIPFVAPYLPGLARFPADEVRQAMAGALGGFFSLALVVALGSGFWVRDLAEGRLGFYWSRPLKPSALLAGKLFAAWLIAVGCQVILLAGLWVVPLLQGELSEPQTERASILTLLDPVYLPSLSMDSLPLALSSVQLLGVWLVLNLALLLAVHGLALWYRSRSVWLLLDVAALTVGVALASSIVARLEAAQALGALVWIERSALGALALALTAAMWAQGHKARVDLIKSHKIFSLTLWPILLLYLAVVDGVSRFVVSSSPDDLTAVTYAQPSSASPWVVVGGPTRHRARTEAGFLIHLDDDRWWPLGGLDIAASWATFSRQGNRFVWLRCERLSDPRDCEIWSKDLTRPSEAPQPTGRVYYMYPRKIALSPDGQRLAVVRDKTAEIHDLGEKRLLKSKYLGFEIKDLDFVSSTRLRITGSEIQDEGLAELTDALAEWDLESDEIKVHGDFGGQLLGLRAHRNDTLDQLIFYTLFPPAFMWVEVDPWEIRYRKISHAPNDMRFLRDGRVVLMHDDSVDDQLELQVLSPQGEELLSIERAAVRKTVWGGEWTAGHLWLALYETKVQETTSSDSASNWVLYDVDLDGGELRRVRQGLWPLPDSSRFAFKGEPQVGSAATQLFFTDDQRLVRWDGDNEEETILGPVEAGW